MKKLFSNKTIEKKELQNNAKNKIPWLHETDFDEYI